jgi:hypothetical protein
MKNIINKIGFLCVFDNKNVVSSNIIGLILPSTKNIQKLCEKYHKMDDGALDSVLRDNVSGFLYINGQTVSLTKNGFYTFNPRNYDLIGIFK